MFEGALIGRLIADGELASYLAKFSGAPAVFSELAPEGAVTPYLVITISRSTADTPAVEDFVIMCDLFGGAESSRAENRTAAARVEYLLDYGVIPASSRYDTIRIFYENGGPVQDTDPRTIHYNLQFSARAGRSAWAQQLT